MKRAAAAGWRALGARCVAGLALGFGFPLEAQVQPEYELPPIAYTATEASNRVSALSPGVLAAAGDETARVRRVLEALEVPVDSQVLVFSKTSLQRRRIAPGTPRAIYFSDDLYLGWVPGGLMEAAASDARLGLAFYHFDLQSAEPGGFQRDPECLSCHAGPLTRNWPGLMVRSVYVDEGGEPIGKAGGFLTGHESPLGERWGGWYVTGQHGRGRHLGNVTAREVDQGAELDRAAGANVAELSRRFSTGRYLRPDSDIVALMVLEHQVQMHDRLVEGGLRVRKWMHYQQLLQKELGEPVQAEPTGSAKRVVESEAERILEYLLFCDEAALPEGGISGAGAFEKAFARNRRPDATGRALKDFDLRTRLFTYRCSYMIYSEAFAALPEVLRRRVYERLRAVLQADAPPKRFAHLDAAERLALREILMATKPELAHAWSRSGGP